MAYEGDLGTVSFSCPLPLETRTASKVYAIESVSIVSDFGKAECIELQLADSGKPRLMMVLITEIYAGNDTSLAQLARSNENRSVLIKRIQEEYEIIVIQYLEGEMYFLVPKVNHTLRTQAAQTSAKAHHFVKQT